MLACIELGESFLSAVRELKNAALAHPEKKEFLFPLEEVELSRHSEAGKKYFLRREELCGLDVSQMGSKKRHLPNI